MPINARYVYRVQFKFRIVDPDLDAYSDNQLVYAFGSWSEWHDLWEFASNAEAWVFIHNVSELSDLHGWRGMQALCWRVRLVIAFR